jgi:DNA-directed RNA polymerase subunit beta
MKEVQSLSLDMQVQSEEGGILEVHEEDDDLLRAAEELGIDLSASLRQREVLDAGEALDVPGLSGFLGAGASAPAEADDDDDGDGDEAPLLTGVDGGDDDIDLTADDEEEGESAFPDIVNALGVELDNQPVEAEPDETDHSDE